jgi:hypothetical protein
VSKAHSAAQIVAYFDDTNVVGPAAAAAHLFEALSIEVRIAGLTPVASKSAAHSLEQDMVAAAAAELGVLHARDVLVIAGTPIGTNQFVRDLLSCKRQQVRDEIQRLFDLPHPLTCQDEWVILSRSLQLRLLHLSQTLLWASLTSNNTLQTFARLPSRSSASLTPTLQG